MKSGGVETTTVEPAAAMKTATAIAKTAVDSRSAKGNGDHADHRSAIGLMTFPPGLRTPVDAEQQERFPDATRRQAIALPDPNG